MTNVSISVGQSVIIRIKKDISIKCQLLVKNNRVSINPGNKIDSIIVILLLKLFELFKNNKKPNAFTSALILLLVQHLLLLLLLSLLLLLLSHISLSRIGSFNLSHIKVGRK